MMIDVRDETWAAVVAHCEKQIEDIKERLTLDGVEMPEIQSLRGEIRALKDIINLPGTINHE